MIEKNTDPADQAPADTSATPGDMAAALDAVRASSPALGAALDAAKVTPDDLAGAHDRATSEEHDKGDQGA
ncbi:MAG: hypothetical protein ACRDS1_06415 [Pseudonocardiaceae bacterium]